MGKYIGLLSLCCLALHFRSTSIAQCTELIWLNEQVNWEKELKECEVEIKIKGDSKHEIADHNFAEKYKEVEIIWLHFEKSMKKADKIVPIRVYLVSEKLKNGSHAEYIIHSEDKKAGINAPIFPDWKSKKNRFYLAECFDKVYK